MGAVVVTPQVAVDDTRKAIAAELQTRYDEVFGAYDVEEGAFRREAETAMRVTELEEELEVLRRQLDSWLTPLKQRGWLTPADIHLLLLRPDPAQPAEPDTSRRFFGPLSSHATGHADPTTL